MVPGIEITGYVRWPDDENSHGSSLMGIAEPVVEGFTNRGRRAVAGLGVPRARRAAAKRRAAVPNAGSARAGCGAARGRRRQHVGAAGRPAGRPRTGVRSARAADRARTPEPPAHAE